MKKSIIFILLVSFLFFNLYSITEFSLPKLDGSLYKISEVIGKKVIIIDFWASWCKPCKKLLKRLKKLNKHYKGEIEIIAISIDNTSAFSKVESYVKRKKFKFTVLLDKEHKVINNFNPTGGIPFTLIIDKKGDIVYKHSGFMVGFENLLMKKIDKLINR